MAAMELNVSFTDANSSYNGGLNQLIGGLNQTPDYRDGKTCWNFLFIVNRVVIGLICFFGIAGNMLSFVVLQWKMKHSSATLLLRALAVADTCFLLTVVTYYCFISVNGELFSRVLFPLLETSRLGTVWVTVLVAFNRYIAVCRPLQASRLCTERRVKLQLAVTATCVVLYNIPLIIYHMVYMYDTEVMPFTYTYELVYETILYSAFYFGVPLTVISVFNVSLVCHLYASRSSVRRHTSQGHADDERSVTIIMVAVIVVFLCCQAAGVYNKTALMIIYTYPSCGDINFYIIKVNNAIVITNSAVNFIIYCAVGRQFRAGLKQLCSSTCRGHHSPAGHSLEVIAPRAAADVV